MIVVALLIFTMFAYEHGHLAPNRESMLRQAALGN